MMETTPLFALLTRGFDFLCLQVPINVYLFRGMVEGYCHSAQEAICLLANGKTFRSSKDVVCRGSFNTRPISSRDAGLDPGTDFRWISTMSPIQLSASRCLGLGQDWTACGMSFRSINVASMSCSLFRIVRARASGNLQRVRTNSLQSQSNHDLHGLPQSKPTQQIYLSSVMQFVISCCFSTRED